MRGPTRPPDFAEAWMAYGLNDVMNQNRFIDQSDADDNFAAAPAPEAGRAMLGYAETCECRRVRLLAHFGEASTLCGNRRQLPQTPKMIDALTEAKMLISCIWRLQQKSGMSFGATHVVDVLLGAKTEPILRHGHDQVSTYGIGTGHEAAVAQHRAPADRAAHPLGRYGKLQRAPLGEKANAVLRDEIAVRVRASVAEDGGVRTAPGQRRRSTSPAARSAFEPPLARRGGARKRQPAYLIFTDRTLAQISKKHPPAGGGFRLHPGARSQEDRAVRLGHSPHHRGDVGPDQRSFLRGFCLRFETILSKSQSGRSRMIFARIPICHG